MKIDIETLRKTKGIGSKTLERIIEQHKIDNEIKEKYDKKLDIIPPKNLNIELNDIYQGESVEFMRRHIPDKSIDMVLTSPPYDNIRDYNGYDFNHELMLYEIYRVLKEGGVCVWIVGDAIVNGSESGSSFKQALKAMEIGFNLHDTMIYRKNSYPFPDKTRYYQVFEYMFVFSKGRPKTHNIQKVRTKWKKASGEISTYRSKDGTTKEMMYRKGLEYRNMDNVWDIDTGYMKSTTDKIAYEHPAIFPDALAKRHILSWSNEGDIVLDPMCGSGTTCKMAKLNDRKFIGIDISEEYVSLSKKRLMIK